MDPKKVSILANGILAICDALDTPFSDVIEDMETIGIIDEDEREAVIQFTGG